MNHRGVITYASRVALASHDDTSMVEDSSEPSPLINSYHLSANYGEDISVPVLD